MFWDYGVIGLLEMLGRLIGIVRIVRFSDSQIIGIVGLSDSRTVNLLETLDRLIWMESVRQADQNCWNGWILWFLDCQILGIVG